jgi:lysine-specific demethylase 3
MCDACDATLFNHHWACGKCGFVVCLDCYKRRKNEEVTRNVVEREKDRDEYSWLLCTNKTQHELDKLILVQIIPGSILEDTSDEVDKYFEKLVSVNGVKKENGGDESSASRNGGDSKLKMSDIIDQTVENSMDCDEKKIAGDKKSESDQKRLKNFVRSGSEKFDFSKHQVKMYSSKETKLLYPGVAHSWLDGGKVLKLEKADGENDADVLSLFREMWRRCQPVVVSNVVSRMDTDLWTPDAFSRKEVVITAADVLTSQDATGLSLAEFFAGYNDISKRISDSVADSDESELDEALQRYEPRVLTLRNWPPSGEEFNEFLPAQTLDLFKNLPLPRYTARNSLLNMTVVLPDVFVRPDLGPRACISYGLGVKECAPDVGTVLLHVERSDSFALLVHTGDTLSMTKPVVVAKSLDAMDCSVSGDDALRDRILKRKEFPGCVWHIFHPSDADKVRDYMNRCTNEDRRKKLDVSFDPLHEGNAYLDAAKRKVLKEEYGVEPFTVHQFHGEAVFIPAGAPRQVTNNNPNNSQ